MHSMTAVLAANTTTSPPTIGGGGLAVVAVILLIVVVKAKGANAHSTDRPGKVRSFVRAVVSTYKALVSVFRAIWSVVRFYGGRELRGEPRSTATFLRAGTPLNARPGKPDQAVSMATIAVAPPRVSLLKTPVRQPRPWARNAATWLKGYRGRGARALDWTVRTVLWSARMAGRTWRFLKAVWRVLRAVYGVVAPPVVLAVRVLRAWHCWPYAARGLVRLIATAALVAWVVPAWTGWACLAMVAATVPLGFLLPQLVPAKPGDDAVYGPRIWAVLRDDLDLPEDEPREKWLLLPPSLAAEDARIVIRLPWTWRGSEGDRENLSALVNSRVPGQWVARVSLTGETFTAVFTHKPPPKPPAPEPECPAVVPFFDPDIQEAIANCKTGEIVLGKDTFGRIIICKLDGETPHWALSVGTGGGKSTFNQAVIVQAIAQGYHVIVVDVKRSSVKSMEGIPGVHIYKDPKNPQDMRRAVQWFKDEIDARSYVKDHDPSVEFPGLLLIIEESNEFADVSKEWWDDNRKPTSDKEGPADRATDPVWGDVASAARLGRFVRGNIIGVFQDLRDQALGGKGLRNLFRLKLMGNYSTQQWKNVIGTTPVPPSIDKAGRMLLVEGNSNTWVQTLYGEGDELKAWAMEHRAKQNFDPTAGLFGDPPERSAERMPYLVRLSSRDEAPESPFPGSEEGQDQETAGRLSHEGADVTLLEGDVTASRDRLRLIPGQGGEGAAQDPTAPPELLPLAEISRRLGPDEGVPKYDALRQHKARRDDFPKGVEINGKEHYTESQIIAYYEAQEKQA